jgi:hypothetical protein
MIDSVAPQFTILDSCEVKNGGCDKNADCSHDATSYDVVCTCKTGYTNVGKDGKVVCLGKLVTYCLTSHNNNIFQI